MGLNKESEALLKPSLRGSHKQSKEHIRFRLTNLAEPLKRRFEHWEGTLAEALQSPWEEVLTTESEALKPCRALEMRFEQWEVSLADAFP